MRTRVRFRVPGLPPELVAAANTLLCRYYGRPAEDLPEDAAQEVYVAVLEAMEHEGKEQLRSINRSLWSFAVRYGYFRPAAGARHWQRREVPWPPKRFEEVEG